MLIFAQIMSVIYLVASMRLRNTRTIKLLIMCIVLLGVAGCGLGQSLIAELNSSSIWSTSTRKSIEDNSFVLEAIQIGLILFGVTFNTFLYIL